jgi:hypothetical protein
MSVPSPHHRRVCPEDKYLHHDIYDRRYCRQSYIAPLVSPLFPLTSVRETEELTTKEQRQRRKRAVLGFEAFHKRRKRKDVHERVEEVEVYEWESVDAVYYTQDTGTHTHSKCQLGFGIHGGDLLLLFLRPLHFLPFSKNSNKRKDRKKGKY